MLLPCIATIQLAELSTMFLHSRPVSPGNCPVDTQLYSISTGPKLSGNIEVIGDRQEYKKQKDFVVQAF